MGGGGGVGGGGGGGCREGGRGGPGGGGGGGGVGGEVDCGGHLEIHADIHKKGFCYVIEYYIAWLSSWMLDVDASCSVGYRPCGPWASY